MDNYLKLFVSVSLWSLISTGRSYRVRYGKPYDSHSQFHHGFEHHDLRRWHDGVPEWDPPQRRLHINNAQKRHPIIHRNDYEESKEYWRQHHPATLNKYSPWKYYQGPKFNEVTSSPVKPLPPITPPGPFTSLKCMLTCSATSEYNPVCGTNNVTYSNPSRLECAKQCGIKVKLRSKSRCPSIYDTNKESYVILPYFGSTGIPIVEAEYSESDEFWSDKPLTEPTFFYVEYSESTFDITKTEPTRTPVTESTSSKPSSLLKHLVWASRGQRPKVTHAATTDAMDEDDDTDDTVHPFDIM